MKNGKSTDVVLLKAEGKKLMVLHILHITLNSPPFTQGINDDHDYYFDCNMFTQTHEWQWCEFYGATKLSMTQQYKM